MNRYVVACVLLIGIFASPGCNKREAPEVKASVVAVQAARDKGDRQATVNALRSIPPEIRSAAENQLLAQLEGVTGFESEVELAKQKSDVDGLFLALTKIQKAAFLSGEESALLQQCGETLKNLQMLREQLAKHDHESVIYAADDILAAFPNNIEARKAFTESGLIFGYLRTAKKATGAISDTSQKTVAKTDNEDQVAATIAKLAEAEKALGQALRLDPQYGLSLTLQKSVRGVQNIAAGFLAEKAAELATTVMSGSEAMAVKVYNTVNSDYQSTGRILKKGPWDYYQDHRKPIEEAVTILAAAVADRNERIAALKGLRNDENAEVVDSAVQLLQMTPEVVAGYLMPSGTWPQHSQAIDETQAKVRQAKAKYATANSAYLAVFKRGFEDVKQASTMPHFRQPEKADTVLKKREALLQPF